MSDQGKLLLGCTGAILLLGAQAMWFVLLYVILESITAEAWVWCLYWVYVPVTALAIVISKIIEAFARGDN